MALVLALLIGALILISGCKKKSDMVVPPPATVAGVSAENGYIYKAVMGTSNVTPTLLFRVHDDKDQPVSGTYVQCHRVVGDGTLQADSLKSDSNGRVTFQYAFDGLRGDAILMAKVPGIDSSQVTLRANTLIPGNGGQAQYILFTDKYEDVKAFNGVPASVDADPYSWIVYANYEQSLGVVFVLPDVNHDSTAVDTADVLAIIVNTVYKGKTKDSIGIGSTLQEVRAAYGTPDTIKYDPPAPPIYIRYVDLGLLLYGDTQLLNGIPVADTIIHEIHLTDQGSNTVPVRKPFGYGKKAPNAFTAEHRYHPYFSLQ